MRVYTRVVIDMATGTTEHAEGYVYSGAVALCKGGSSSSTTVDKEYNKRLAAIQERQQDIADQYFAYWNEVQKPYETLQAQSNTELLPYETEAYKQQQLLTGQQAQAGQELLPWQTGAAQAKLADQIDTIGQMQPVKTNFFQQAAQGKDVAGAMASAQADAAKGFEDAAAATARNMSRMGVNPNSGRYAGVNAEQDLAKAAAVAGARTQARTTTEDENFRRLALGMQYGMQGAK